MRLVKFNNSANIYGMPVLGSAEPSDTHAPVPMGSESELELCGDSMQLLCGTYVALLAEQSWGFSSHLHVRDSIWLQNCGSTDTPATCRWGISLSLNLGSMAALTNQIQQKFPMLGLQGWAAYAFCIWEHSLSRSPAIMRGSPSSPVEKGKGSQ